MSRTLLAVNIGLVFGCSLFVWAPSASAQFIQPVNPTTLPTPVQSGLGQLPSNVSSAQLQKILLLRALQQRAGSNGGVKRGVPQFIPFGDTMMPNAGMQNQFATPMTQPAAADPPQAKGKTAEEKKAEYQAAREERKRKTRERAEARKAKAAERAKAKAPADAKSDPA